MIGTSPQIAEPGSGTGISMASLRRFWAVAARWNSSRAPFGPRNRSLPAIVLERLPGGASVGVTGVVVSEVLAREGAVGALGFVEHRDVRLDPAIMDQPVQHIGRAVGGVADQPGGVQIEAIQRPLDH